MVTNITLVFLQKRSRIIFKDLNIMTNECCEICEPQDSDNQLVGLNTESVGATLVSSIQD